MGTVHRQSCMTIRAMVMAAGAGTRLRPLTDELPKPMVPIANRPVLEYTLENLKRHGITDIIFNLHSHPELIRKHFGDGSRWGVHIEYSPEPRLMGTAGGVRKASRFFLGKTCLVMSGDGLTDIDLTDLVNFHRRSKSVATMALSEVDTKFDYGITLTNAGGRIQRFVEKPRWGEVFSNQVNTGIYVLEPSVIAAIPENKVVDFGHDVWPSLFKKKKPIFARLSSRYWCDVGNYGEYQRAQRDFLDRKVDFSLPGREIRRRVWAEEGAVIEKGAHISGPCLIGRNARIASGARVGPYVVIGHDAKVGSNASLRHCTLWDHVKVGPKVRLEGCVIGQRTHVNESVTAYGGILLSETWQGHSSI